MATGDIDAIVATLHPDVVVVGDSNGTTGTAINVIHGPDKFARFYLGLFERYGDAAMETLKPVLVNGQLGVWTSGWEGEDARTSSPSGWAASRCATAWWPRPTTSRTRRSWAASGWSRRRLADVPRNTTGVPEEKPWSVMPSAWLNRARWFSRAMR